VTFKSEIRTLSERPLFRGLALVILLTASTRLEPLASAVLDLDLWWHLRDGDSILTQHALPHSGVFTQYFDHSWVAYSWGFEVIASRFYHWFGLIGLVALRSTLEVMITASLFIILWRGLGSFWQAWPLTGAGMWAIHHCLGLQPMLFSILMFTLELGLIFEARRRGTIRPLLYMPVLFLLWANLHIQFAYGIFVLGLLVGAGLARAAFPSIWSDLPDGKRDLPVAQLLGVAALSGVATLMTPYTWHLYGAIFSYMRSSVPYVIITELQALNFRVPEHFVLLLIVGAGFFALGWRRSRDPFQLALMILSTIIAFRMTRDSWVACIPALAIIGDRQVSVAQEGTGKQFPRFAFAAGTAVATFLMFLVVTWDSKVSNTTLNKLVAASFPVNACAFVRAQSLPGPIYNDMNWGGFLIWALPERPVSIDNRTDLYGDEVLSRFYLVQSGAQDWRSDPDLNAAQVVLLNRRIQLANLLSQDQRFHLIYQDAIADVFIRIPPR